VILGISQDPCGPKLHESNCVCEQGNEKKDKMNSFHENDKILTGHGLMIMKWYENKTIQHGVQSTPITLEELLLPLS